MKCIYCKTDSNYRDRVKNSGRCKSCKHLFAYEPKSNPLKLTDGAMQSAVKAVSGDGAIAFTARNLWYELNRRLGRKRYWRQPWGMLAGAGAAALPVSFVVASVAGMLAVPVAGLGVAGLTYAFVRNRQEKRRGTQRPLLDAGTFDSQYLTVWTRTHGAPERLLPPPTRALTTTPHQPDPDVAAYSFDRAVVTDRAETADLLLANNFHFEHNCAVLSVDGYPQNAFQTVMTMLRRNPTLTVFALHDATPEGCRLPGRLREEGWFPDPSVRVVDLGLRPAQAEKLGLMRPWGKARALNEEERRSLSAEEVAWFEAGESAELAALRPARLMRAVFQGFAVASRSGSDGAAGDGGGDGGFFIWSSGDGAEIYAADSFG